MEQNLTLTDLGLTQDQIFTFSTASVALNKFKAMDLRWEYEIFNDHSDKSQWYSSIPLNTNNINSKFIRYSIEKLLDFLIGVQGIVNVTPDSLPKNLKKWMKLNFKSKAEIKRKIQTIFEEFFATYFYYLQGALKVQNKKEELIKRVSEISIIYDICHFQYSFDKLKGVQMKINEVWIDYSEIHLIIKDVFRKNILFFLEADDNGIVAYLNNGSHRMVYDKYTEMLGIKKHPASKSQDLFNSLARIITAPSHNQNFLGYVKINLESLINNEQLSNYKREFESLQNFIIFYKRLSQEMPKQFNSALLFANTFIQLHLGGNKILKPQREFSNDILLRQHFVEFLLKPHRQKKPLIIFNDKLDTSLRNLIIHGFYNSKFIKELSVERIGLKDNKYLNLFALANDPGKSITLEAINGTLSRRKKHIQQEEIVQEFFNKFNKK